MSKSKYNRKKSIILKLISSIIIFSVFFESSMLISPKGFENSDDNANKISGLSSADIEYLNNIKKKKLTYIIKEDYQYFKYDGKNYGTDIPYINILRDVFGLNIDVKCKNRNEVKYLIENKEEDLISNFSEETKKIDDFKYVNPIKNSAEIVIARKNDKTLEEDDIEKLQHKKIGVVNGFDLSFILSSIMNQNVKFDGFKDIDQIIKAFDEKRIDAFIINDVDKMHLLGLKEKNIKTYYAQSTIKNTFGTNKKELYRLLEIVNKYVDEEKKAKVIDSFKENELIYIKKWFKENKKNELQKISEKGEFNAYLDSDIFPMCFKSGEKYTGIVPDIMNLFNSVTGCNIKNDESLNDTSKKDAIRSLTNNDIQFVSTMVDEYKNSNISLSKDIVDDHKQLVVLNDSNSYYDNFIDKKIGIIDYDTNIMVNSILVNKFITFKNYTDMMTALRNKEIDAMLIPDMYLQYLYSIKKEFGLRVIKEIGEESNIAIGLNSKNKELNSILEDVIFIYKIINQDYEHTWRSQSMQFYKKYIDSYENTVEKTKRFLILCFCALCIILILIGTNYIFNRKYKKINRGLKLILDSSKKIDVLELNTKKNLVTSATNFKIINNGVPRHNYSMTVDEYTRYMGEDANYYCNIISKPIIDDYQKNRKIKYKEKSIWICEKGVKHGKNSMSILIADITEDIKREHELKNKAEIDSLTGLFNGYIYKDKIKELILKDKNCMGIFAFLDVNNFKEINDSYGHAFGDAVLKGVGENLKKLLDSKTIVFRIAGDEFGIYKHGIKLEDLNTFINECIPLTKIQMPIEGVKKNIDMSMGVSIYNHHTNDIKKLKEYADFAMYSAKRNRDNKNYIIFDEDEYKSEKNIKVKMNEVLNVLENNELFPVFQPIYNLKNDELYGYEGLSRTTNKAFSNILDLINTAENIEKSFKLSELMSDNILKEFALKKKSGEKLFLNLDMTNLKEHFSGLNSKLEFINNLGIDYQNVVMEVTERTQIENSIVLDRIIKRYKNEGMMVAIDDYGAGYSNESSLIRIQPHIIKLDKNVIKDIDIDNYKKVLVSKFVQFAKSTGVKVLAEGIETKDELKTLKDLGVDLGQGFYLGKPKKFE